MADDMDIIRQIEEQIGFKLNPVPFKKIMRLGVNGIVRDNIKQVTGLNLDNTKIKDISLLRNLCGLTHLSLNHNHINNLTPLSAMTNLTNLDLHRNQITDLTPLSSLTNLKKINLGNNKITNIASLSSLTNLTELYLGSNQITDLTPLSVLKHLKNLRLTNNQITELTPLHTLTNLKELYLISNKVTALFPLRVLSNLTVLDLSRNQITEIPSDITTWWPHLEIMWVNGYKGGLNLYKNPLTNPPVEIVKQGHAAVLNYFAEIKSDSVLFLESKLLLVGSGEVGKTTLMKKLKDNAFQVKTGEEGTTRGIEIQPWTLSCAFNDGEFHNVKIHFWDFGGQEILHATHQFFLTKRSLYLFVWEARKEEEIQSFDYWLNAVKLFGADSPVIVVMNKYELRVKQIAEASFKEKFPNIAQFIQVSCVTGHRIPELTEIIRGALSQMQHLLDKLPKRWMNIRDELKGMNRDYIPLDDYFAVCDSYGMDKEKALFLSDYLHDLGVILHFRMDPLLADTVVLKPEWATGAVYALIDSLDIQQRQGKFNRSELSKYWKNDRYPSDKHSLLLRLMEKFELCFNIVGTDDYIIPELLQAERKDIDHAAYRSTHNLHLHYSYDFMPAGIVTRFISRIHYLIRNDHYWKNGVELAFDQSAALVVNDPVQKRIKISVSGNSPVQLMAIIRSHFEHIHETLNMEKDEHVFEEVPCVCSQCVKSEKPNFYEFNLLQKLMSKKRDAFCGKSAEDVSVHRLLNGLLPPQKTENLFETVITVLSQVQGISKTLQPDENSRNTIVALLLGTRGFHVKDQSLWSTAASGKHMGELDIKIEDDSGRAVSIIEALNLKKWDKTKIDNHVNKLIHNYDCNGLKENYIVVYASTNDFSGLCDNYNNNLKQIDYEKYPLKGDVQISDIRLNKIKAFRACHKCNDGETVLHHILVEMGIASPGAR